MKTKGKITKKKISITVDTKLLEVMDKDLTNKESYERVASSIIEIMKDENKQEKLRQQMIIQDTSCSWDNISLIWLNNLILN